MKPDGSSEYMYMFSKSNNTELPKKVDRPFLNCFNDIKTMLEKKDISMTHPIRNNNVKLGEQNKENLKLGEQNKSRKYEFNASSAKVRILENKIVKPHREIEQPLPTKEERSKAIAAKLQKVVENFKKNISRQSSNKNITSSQKSTSSNFEESSGQKTYARQENTATKMDVVHDTPNMEYVSTGASQQLQNLNITNIGKNKPETIILNQESNNHFNQSINNQYRGRSAPHLSQETEFSRKREFSFIGTQQDTFGNKKYSQDNRTLAKGLVMTPMVLNQQVKQTESTFGEKSKFALSNPGFGGLLNKNMKNTIEEMKLVNTNTSFKKPEAIGFNEKFHIIGDTRVNNGNPSVSDDTSSKKPIFIQKNQFMMGDSGREFNSNFNNRNYDQGGDRKPPENFGGDNESYMKAGGISSYNFGNDTQFSQILNTSGEYDGGYTSPQFDQSFISPGENHDVNTIPNFGGSTNFTEQPLFSFGQMNPFSFK